MPAFERDDLRFHYRDEGDGVPFVFQHGLGGDLAQPFEFYPPRYGVRLLGFDCRGHGETRPLGDAASLSFAHFAADLIALLDGLAIEQAIVGGISMGAGLALHVAVRWPERVRALILVRPAWLDGPMPEWARETYAEIAQLIRAHGAARGRELFAASERYRDRLRASPATAASLLGQFDRPRAEEAVAVLERLPADVPIADLNVLAAVHVPTLILVNREDPVHPFAFGSALAGAIPGARLQEIPSKSADAGRHVAEARSRITAFLAACADA